MRKCGLARGICRHLVVVLLAGTSIASCVPERLERTNFLFCPSPDGELTAIFSVMSGGGAAGTVFEQVTVKQAGTEDEVVLFEMGNGSDVVLTWVSDSRLRIEHPSDAITTYRRKQFRERLESGRVLEVALAEKESKNGKFLHDTRRCGA